MHQIGVGVLGPVFRAQDSVRDQLVAVKMFRLDAPPEQAAQIADALQTLVSTLPRHSGLLPLIAAGVERDMPYLVMTHSDVPSLDTRLKPGVALEPDQALGIIRMLAEAIDAAHARDIVHGSLHPRDIFVDEHGDVRVSGFGVGAALVRAGLRPPVRRPYSAPERLMANTIEPPADRFALGALAFELLSGRRLVGTGRDAAARCILPVPPGGDAPAGDAEYLRTALAAMLAENPEHRPSRAAAFAQSLAISLFPRGSGPRARAGRKDDTGSGAAAAANGPAADGPRTGTGRHKTASRVTRDDAPSADELELFARQGTLWEPESRVAPKAMAAMPADDEGDPLALFETSPEKTAQREVVAAARAAKAGESADDDDKRAAADVAKSGDAERPDVKPVPVSASMQASDMPDLSALPELPDVPEVTEPPIAPGSVAASTMAFASPVVPAPPVAPVTLHTRPIDLDEPTPTAFRARTFLVLDQDEVDVAPAEVARGPMFIDDAHADAGVAREAGVRESKAEPEPGVLPAESSAATVDAADAGVRAVTTDAADVVGAAGSADDGAVKGSDATVVLPAERFVPPVGTMLGIAGMLAHGREDEEDAAGAGDAPVEARDRSMDADDQSIARDSSRLERAAAGLAASAWTGLEAGASSSSDVASSSANVAGSANADEHEREADEEVAAAETAENRSGAFDRADALNTPASAQASLSSADTSKLSHAADSAAPVTASSGDSFTEPPRERTGPIFHEPEPADTGNPFRLIALVLAIGLAVGGAAGYLVGKRGALQNADNVVTVPETAPVAGDGPGAQAPDAASQSTGAPSPARGTSARAAGNGSAAPSAANNTNAAGRAAAPARPAPTTGRLVVRSSPSRAEVAIDGSRRGVTPLTLRNLPLGSHVVRVTRPGYAPEARRVTLSATRASESLTFELERVAAPPQRPAAGAAPAASAAAPAPGATAGMGALHVLSRPAGARVTVDGRPVGVTPLLLQEVAPGARTVRLELAGHRPWTTTVQVTAGQRVRVAASLEEGSQE